MSISVDYHEDEKQIVVTTLCDKHPIVRTTTNKVTNVTTIEIYMEGCKKPVEYFVYTDV